GVESATQEHAVVNVRLALPTHGFAKDRVERILRRQPFCCGADGPAPIASPLDAIGFDGDDLSGRNFLYLGKWRGRCHEAAELQIARHGLWLERKRERAVRSQRGHLGGEV